MNTYTSGIKDQENSEIHETMFGLTSQKLDSRTTQHLDEAISENEIEKIIQDSPKDKSPGTDGLTTEFYQKMWPDIKHLVIKAFNEALTEGELGISQKQGIISLIPKVCKDPDHIKNWRPITLLNQDYKILAKCIAKRCEDLIPMIVSTDQTGFVNGRLINTNLHRVQNLIEHCKEYNINGLLVNIDFEKAFDSIEWPFIWKALKYFNFPEKIISSKHFTTMWNPVFQIMAITPVFLNQAEESDKDVHSPRVYSS